MENRSFPDTLIRMASGGKAMAGTGGRKE